MSEQYLRTKQLRARYGNVSHMWIERRLESDTDFPRAIKMGRLRFWKLSELETWEAAQNQPGPKPKITPPGLKPKSNSKPKSNAA
jgi:predicted DNA-binding transcriptional regulator AlpA